MTEKRIKWKLIEENCSAYNKRGEYLGYLVLEKVGRWNHWCWYQFEDIKMSSGCLQEVRDKQKELKKK